MDSPVRRKYGWAFIELEGCRKKSSLWLGARYFMSLHVIQSMHVTIPMALSGLNVRSQTRLYLCWWFAFEDTKGHLYQVRRHTSEESPYGGQKQQVMPPKPSVRGEYIETVRSNPSLLLPLPARTTSNTSCRRPVTRSVGEPAS